MQTHRLVLGHINTDCVAMADAEGAAAIGARLDRVMRQELAGALAHVAAPILDGYTGVLRLKSVRIQLDLGDRLDQFGLAELIAQQIATELQTQVAKAADTLRYWPDYDSYLANYILMRLGFLAQPNWVFPDLVNFSHFPAERAAAELIRARPAILQALAKAAVEYGDAAAAVVSWSIRAQAALVRALVAASLDQIEGQDVLPSLRCLLTLPLPLDTGISADRLLAESLALVLRVLAQKSRGPKPLSVRAVIFAAIAALAVRERDAVAPHDISANETAELDKSAVATVLAFVESDAHCRLALGQLAQMPAQQRVEHIQVDTSAECLIGTEILESADKTPWSEGEALHQSVNSVSEMDKAVAEPLFAESPEQRQTVQDLLEGQSTSGFTERDKVDSANTAIDSITLLEMLRTLVHKDAEPCASPDSAGNEVAAALARLNAAEVTKALALAENEAQRQAVINLLTAFATEEQEDSADRSPFKSALDAAAVKSKLRSRYLGLALLLPSVLLLEAAEHLTQTQVAQVVWQTLEPADWPEAAGDPVLQLLLPVEPLEVDLLAPQQQPPERLLRILAAPAREVYENSENNRRWSALLLADFASRLRGLHGSSHAYLRSQFLEHAGELRCSDDQISVFLDPIPLGIILQMAGFPGVVGRLPQSGRSKLVLNIGDSA